MKNINFLRESRARFIFHYRFLKFLFFRYLPGFILLFILVKGIFMVEIRKKEQRLAQLNQDDQVIQETLKPYNDAKYQAETLARMIQAAHSAHAQHHVFSVLFATLQAKHCLLQLKSLKWRSGLLVLAFEPASVCEKSMGGEYEIP